MQIILTALAVGAAIVSAACAFLAYRQSKVLSTREKIDILKAEILQVISTIEGRKQWEASLMASYRENGNIAANIEVVVPLFESKYDDDNWIMLLPAALEELKNEGYDKLFRNLTDVPLSRKDRAQ